MLSFLIGPSGCGKTTIMNTLRSQHGWRVVPTYTTRPPREGERDKISISADEFARLSLDGRFFTAKVIYGNFYGEDAVAIRRAVNANIDEKWCLDLAISEIEKYYMYETTKFFIMPESIDQLIAQLVDADREDRIGFAVNDFDSYSEAASRMIGNGRVFTIVNGPGNQSEAARRINELTNN